MSDWTDQAKALILKHEGLRLAPYKDSLGILTIGVGFNLTRPDARARLAQVGVTSWAPPLRITQDQAYQLLNVDISDAIRDLTTMFSDFNLLSDNQKSALVDMRFQLGPVRLRGFHRFIAAVNARHFDTAVAEMLSSDWATQTPSRAQEDARLMKV